MCVCVCVCVCVCRALLNCASLTVEAVTLAAISSRTPGTADGISAWCWRYLSIGASVVNIYFLMLSNLAILYGFGGSWDFVMAFVHPPPPATSSEVITCHVVAFWWLFCGVLLMFEVSVLRFSLFTI